MTTYLWRFGFNDPTLSGWVITVGYFVSFLLCLWAGAKAKRAAAKAAGKGAYKPIPVRGAPKGAVGNAHDVKSCSGRQKGDGLWFLLTIIPFLLGVNKQIDLQTLLGDIGRAAARSQGWYQKRRAAQAAFIAFFALECGLVVVFIAKKAGKRRGEYSASSIGIVLLLSSSSSGPGSQSISTKCCQA
jgi:hypothetical protein